MISSFQRLIERKGRIGAVWKIPYDLLEAILYTIIIDICQCTFVKTHTIYKTKIKS